MKTKKEIRKEILAKRDELTDIEREEKSRLIIKRILKSEEYMKADKVLCFVTYKSEVITDELIKASVSDGKEVYVPTVVGDEMKFYRIRSLEELGIGYKGIREPKIDTEKELTGTEKTDIMIMPGAVFDKELNRIGYGKGFYDRYLAKKFEGKRIAVAYDLQVVEAESFETLDTDIKPDKLVTESTCFAY